MDEVVWELKTIREEQALQNQTISLWKKRFCTKERLFKINYLYKINQPMKAIISTKYGPPDVLQLKEIKKPIPNDNEVLIKIHATTVNRTDTATLRGKPFFARLFTGLLKPNNPIPGTDFSGKIEKVGKDVKQFLDKI